MQFRLLIYSLLLAPHQRNKWQFNMEWGAKSRLYIRLLTPHCSFCRFLSFTPRKYQAPMYTSPKETLLRHWDKEKHCSIVRKCNFVSLYIVYF